MDGGSMQVLEKSGERGRNRTYNLLIKSSEVGQNLPRFSTFKSQQLTHNQARTGAIWSGIEKKRVSAHGIEAHGTLMAHLHKSIVVDAPPSFQAIRRK